MSMTSQLRAQAKERKLVAGEAGRAEGHNAHLLDACELVKSAWDATTETTIARCWLKAETLRPEMEATLAAAEGRGVRRGKRDPNVLALEKALGNLSLGIRDVAGSGQPVQVEELVGVLASLDLSPGQTPGPTAIAAAQTWATIEDDAKVREALMRDAREDLMDRVQNGVQGEESDEEIEIVNPDKESETRNTAPPPYHIVSDQLNFLEEWAERCGTEDEYLAIRKAKMAVIEAYAMRRSP